MQTDDKVIVMKVSARASPFVVFFVSPAIQRPRKSTTAHNVAKTVVPVMSPGAANPSDSGWVILSG